MNLTGLKTIAKNVGKWIAKHSPKILTGLGCGGVVATTCMAVKATPRAVKKIEAAKKERGVEKLTIKETVKLCWRDYIPTGGMMLATMGCFIGSNVISDRHQAALAGLYSIAEQGLIAKDKELAALKEEMKSALGEDQAKEIQEKAEQKNPKPALAVNETQKLLFSFAGQEFYSTVGRMERAENKINRRLYSSFEIYLTKNEVLDELGLRPDNSDGEDMGIDANDGCELQPCDTYITENGELCIEWQIIPPFHPLPKKG